MNEKKDSNTNKNNKVKIEINDLREKSSEEVMREIGRISREINKQFEEDNER